MYHTMYSGTYCLIFLFFGHAIALPVLPKIGESHYAISKTPRKEAKRRVKEANSRVGVTQREAICRDVEKMPKKLNLKNLV